ncbi:MAG: pyridoxamine 5'-phosphate oxidase [Acidobacteriaceae bacterium]|nr:pyridoxamine 5'-phosphate oxidase [Acidobacteriaceae bacterium]
MAGPPTESPVSLSLEELREEYKRGALDEINCDPNPLQQFRRWMKEAQAAELKEPNAMTLSTATPDGYPSGRIVLLKELLRDGFIFYTNYTSRKGREIEANPHVALTFYWGELERQVRVEGRITKVSRGKSEAYFRGRPKGSRLGALASHQSEILSSRKPLEAKLEELQLRYADSEDVPAPDWWGGYCVNPEVIEFWQGRENRLHDRLLYRRTDECDWVVERLSP